MKAEIIAVGTEILTGQIVNTNAQFLSEKLAEIGVDVYFQTAVGDNEARLLSLLEIASQRSSLVILTGGLGPTEDDLTKQTLAKFLGKELVFDPQAQEKLDVFFAQRPLPSIMIPMCFGTSKGISIFSFFLKRNMFFYLFQYLSLHYTINPHKIGTLASFLNQQGFPSSHRPICPPKKRPLPLP